MGIASETITNVRYIQRLNAPAGRVNPYSFGGGLRNGGLNEDAMSKVSEIASFDYMGAAEYEFGKLPEAFSLIFTRSQTIPLSLKKIKVKGSDVWVLTNESVLEEAVKVVKKLGTTKKMEWKLKCPSLFSSILSGRITGIPTKGWIDLENGYMFFIDEDMAKKFKDLLSPEKTA